MKNSTKKSFDHLKVLLALVMLLGISFTVKSQEVLTWGLLSGTVPEVNFNTSSLSAIADGTTTVTVDISQAASATVGGAVNAVPPGLILTNSFNNSRATVGVSGNTYTYVFSEPVQVILSSQEHSNLIGTENIKISSPDAGVSFSGSLTASQTGHFIQQNNTSEIHIGATAAITTAGTYWTVASNIAITTLSVEYYVTNPTEAASGEPFTMDLAPVPFVRLDNDNSTSAGGIDINTAVCTSGTEPFDGSDLLINAPHGIQRVEINLTNVQNSGEEELSLIGDFPNVTVTGNGTSAVVAVNSAPAVTDFDVFDDIIDEIYYTNTSATPELATPRTIEVVIYDPYGSSSLVATATFSLIQASNSGVTSGPVVVFSTDIATDLTNALDGSQDAGTWVDVDGTGALTGSVVDITSLTIGSYVFRYDVSGSTPCNLVFTSVVLLVLDGNELEMTSPSSCGFVMSAYTDATFSAGSNDPIYVFDTPGNVGELSCPAVGGATYDWYLFNEVTNSYDDFVIGGTNTITNLADGGYLVVRNDGGTKTEGRAWIWNSSLAADAGADITVCNGDSPAIGGAGTILNPTYVYYDPVQRPFIIDANTIVDITFDGVHTFISDVAFFAVTPDESQTVTLGQNTQGFACNPGDDIVNLNFTNDTSGGTLIYDLCHFNNPNLGSPAPGGPLTGTWNAYYEDYQINGAGTDYEGVNLQNIDFSPFIGFDAGQGGWKVQIYDCENLDFGTLTGAIIQFDDGAGDIRTYTSGSINVPINDNSCNAATASIYEVPFVSAVVQSDNTINIAPNIGINSVGGYEWSYSTISATGPWSGPFENVSTTPTVAPTTTTWYRLQMDNGVGCLTEDVTMVTVTDAPNAGTGTDAYVCVGDAVVVLNTLLSGADVGGNWSVSGISPNAPGVDFSAGAGTYDPTTGGVYVFDYTANASSPCAINGTTSVTVSVQEAPNAGINNTIATTNISGTLDLVTDLLGTPDAYGIWTLDAGGDDPGSNFDSSAGTLNTAGLSAGAYVFNYTVTNCASRTATLTVIASVIPCDAGTIAPALSSLTASNVCPITNTVDLTDITASNTPAGTLSLQWHTVPAPADDSTWLADATAITTSGNYYAVFYDSTNDCYSPSTSVVVTIISCSCTLSVGNVGPLAGGYPMDGSGTIPAGQTEVNPFVQSSACMNLTNGVASPNYAGNFRGYMFGCIQEDCPTTTVPTSPEDPVAACPLEQVQYRTIEAPSFTAYLTYWNNNCLPGVTGLPNGINFDRQGFVNQFFCELDTNGYPTVPASAGTPVEGQVTVIPSASEDISATTQEIDGSLTCGTEASLELIQVDFWIVVPNTVSTVGFKLSGNRADAGMFMVGTSIDDMCATAEVINSDGAGTLIEGLGEMFYTIPPTVQSICGGNVLRGRLYITDVAAAFRVTPEINFGNGFSSLATATGAVLYPATSRDDNVIPAPVYSVALSAGIMDESGAIFNAATSVYEPLGCLEAGSINGFLPSCDADGDAVADIYDLDDDNDGILDADESGGIAPLTDADGDGIPVYLDDDDTLLTGTGVGDVNGQVEPFFDQDGDNIANHLDLDSDNDGIYDVVEAGGVESATIGQEGRQDDDDDHLDNTGTNGLPSTVSPGGTPPTNTVTATPLDFINTDSDNDGCSDSNEAYLSANADGGDGGVYNPSNTATEPLNLTDNTIDANGVVIAATYDSGVVAAVTDSMIIVSCEDGDGVDAAIEDAGPNGGDGNGDGILDSLQSNVATILDASGNGSYVTLEITSSTCAVITNIASLTEEEVGVKDLDYDYPLGLVDFTATCVNAGESANLTFYWHGMSSINAYRKFGNSLPGAGDALSLRMR